MSASNIARGPLQFILGSASGQWLALGAGAIAFFPEKVDDILGTSFRKSLAALSAAPGRAAAGEMVQSGPIVIHTVGSNNNGRGGGIVTTIVTYGAGAGAIWVIYMAASNMLPDWVQENLPVSRQFFNKAITNLGKGIIGVKDALSKQIFNLSTKQDALAKKQDDTLREVLDLQKNMGGARQDLMALNESLERCEGQLESAERLQLYTSRGVKLLVRCVANVLPGNDRIMSELLEFTKQGEELRNGTNKGTPPANQPATQPTPAQATPAQQETYRLTTPTTSQYQRPPMPQRSRPSMADQSPENEHHPVVSPMMGRQSSTGSVESAENFDELMQLVREGKIQTIVGAGY